MATPPLRLSDRELVSTQVDYSVQRKGGGFQNLILKGKEGGVSSSPSPTPSSEVSQPSPDSTPATPPPTNGSDQVTAQPVEQDAATVEIKRNRFKKRNEHSNQDREHSRQDKKSRGDEHSQKSDAPSAGGRRLSRKA